MPESLGFDLSIPLAVVIVATGTRGAWRVAREGAAGTLRLAMMVEGGLLFGAVLQAAVGWGFFVATGGGVMAASAEAARLLDAKGSRTGVGPAERLLASHDARDRLAGLASPEPALRRMASVVSLSIIAALAAYLVMTGLNPRSPAATLLLGSALAFLPIVRIAGVVAHAVERHRLLATPE